VDSNEILIGAAVATAVGITGYLIWRNSPQTVISYINTSFEEVSTISTAVQESISQGISTGVDIVKNIANNVGIPAAMVFAVIKAESNGNQNAVSPKGAIGLMQIMPATGASECGFSVDQLYDPQLNVQCGTQYLKKMYDQFQDWNLAIAAYNAGPGRVSNYLKGTQSLPSETVNYQKTVMNNYNSFSNIV
jgi:soluble lytic murein transglycosylase-like protein